MLKQLLWRLLAGPPMNTSGTEVLLSAGQSNRELCLELIQGFKELSDQNYSPLAANGIFINALVPNIAKFNPLLKQINFAVKQGESLDAMKYNLVLVNMTLDQFFISEDGYYIETSEIYTFVEESQKLCELMEGAESAEFGVQEHNLRILTKTFVSLKSILTGLLEVLAR
jgi:hypothetical protein